MRVHKAPGMLGSLSKLALDHVLHNLAVSMHQLLAQRLYVPAGTSGSTLFGAKKGIGTQLRPSHASWGLHMGPSVCQAYAVHSAPLASCHACIAVKALCRRKGLSDISYSGYHGRVSQPSNGVTRH